MYRRLRGTAGGEGGRTIIRSSSFAPGDLGPRRSSCSLLLNFPAFGLLELTPFFDAYNISTLSSFPILLVLLVKIEGRMNRGEEQ
jgi:hypothetical protein